VEYEKALYFQDAVSVPARFPLFSITKNFTLGRLEPGDNISAFAGVGADIYFDLARGNPSGPLHTITTDPELGMIYIAKKEGQYMLTTDWPGLNLEEPARWYRVDPKVEALFILIDQDGEKYTLGRTEWNFGDELKDAPLRVSQTVYAQGVSYTLVLHVEGEIPFEITSVRVEVFRESLDWRGCLAIVVAVAVLAITAYLRHVRTLPPAPVVLR